MKKINLSFLKIIISAVIILLVALTLNSLLSTYTFDKIYKTSLINNYQIILKNLKRSIESSINLEKPFENFYGMNKLLKNIIEKENDIKNIYITDKNGKIIYSTNESLLRKNLPLNRFPVFKENPDLQKNENNDSKTILEKNYYFIANPIYYNSKKWKGIIFIEFAKTIVDRQLFSIIKITLFNLIVSSVIAFFILFLLFILVKKIHDIRKNNDKKIWIKLKYKNFIAIVICLIISQLFFTYMNIDLFRKKYVEMVDKNISTLKIFLKDNIEEILHKGIPIDKLIKIEVLLQDITLNIPECKEIKITDPNGKLQYRANIDKIESVYEKNFSDHKINLSIKDNKQITELTGINNLKQGYLILDINQDLIKKQVNNLILDALTIIIISILISFEILMFIFFMMEEAKLKQKNDMENYNKNKYKIIRPIAFIFYFADAIPLSFLPLFIKKIYTNNPAGFFNFLSPDMILGLPISAYMLGVAIFIPLAGVFVQKISLKEVFVISSLLTFLSFILTAFSGNIIQLIIFRFISGMGYGGIVITGQTFVAINTDSSNRTTGFSDLMSGFFGGNICAAAIGGLIAQRLGYRGALISGAFITLLFILFIIFRVEKSPVKKAHKEIINLGQRIKATFKIFTNRSFLAALLFESIPAQITFIGFIFYICPLYLNSIGTSQANIGRFLTGFGIAVIILGPVFSKIADRIKNDRIFMVLGNVIVGAVLILFFFVKGIIPIILAIVAIGIGNAMVASTEASYISLMKVSKNLGESDVISVFRTFERIGQITGPIIGGLLITSMHYSNSIGVMGIINFAAIILFLLISRNLRKTSIETA